MSYVALLVLDNHLGVPSFIIHASFGRRMTINFGCLLHGYFNNKTTNEVVDDSQALRPGCVRQAGLLLAAAFSLFFVLYFSRD